MEWTLLKMLLRCSTSWGNDGAIKENLHFDVQRYQVFLYFVAVFFKRNIKYVLRVSIFYFQIAEKLVKVWENLKKLWKHLPVDRFPTAFLVLCNFHSCFY